MSILDNFVKEYNEKFIQKKQKYEQGLEGDIKKIKDRLLDEQFFPSIQLKNTLDKQIRRARYPMEVAITGQFSSGKSTFLNALLSRDILPTGITPVTSKVNFINYAEEYKLKITYYSGAQEYAPIETIANFTDQRKHEMNEIKYLTLYAPMDILKDISFVDTPGLNSQSQSDTDTTKRVLRDVGGIIWLTLIDNAGKMSEAQVLEEHMEHFKSKSLCVLNQKDKFTKEQIKTTTTYIKDKFDKYFAQVIPISAKMALESRSHQKNVLLDNSFKQITKEFKKELNRNLDVNSLDFFKNKFEDFHKEIKKIKLKDMSNHMKLLQESNIDEVLLFIENIIRPKAAEAKEFAIKKDLRNICDILIKEYEIIIGVYNSLIKILEDSKEDILQNFDDIHKIYSKKLFDIYNSLELVMEKIAYETYKNIKKQKAFRYEKKNAFLSKDNFEKIEYETYFIDFDNIYKSLFYDDQTIDKMFKKTIKDFKNVQLLIDEAYKNVYRDIKNRVHRWQEPYELIRKHREIGSDLEFSSTRHFAAKVYENVLRFYHRAILENISALRKKFAYFNGAISYSYVQTTRASIGYFEQKISQSVLLYKKEPTKFSIYHPKKDEILTKLKTDFGFEKIENLLTSKRNYLYKIIQFSKEQYLEINKDRIEFVKSKKDIYVDKIAKLKQIKDDI